jgi:hypothetical protein
LLALLDQLEAKFKDEIASLLRRVLGDDHPHTTV